MRKFVTAALVLTFPGLLGTAAGQDNQDQKKMAVQAEVVEIMLLRQKSVRADLKLNASEDEKIYEFTHKQFQTAHEVHKLPEAQQKERWEAMHKENEEFLHKCLSADQRKRLKQIAMQVAGLVLVTKPSIAKELNLTPEQTKKAVKLQKKVHEKFHEVTKAGSSEGRNEKLAELRKTGHEHLIKLLTDQQRAQWEQMVGAPFKGTLVFEETEKAK
jgi:hypothetical protein